MNILLAEDEVQLAEALAEILEKKDFKVDVVHDGESASNYLEHSDYDAFICDIMLPKKDGIQIVKDARAAGIKTPIIMLTAKSNLEDKVFGLEAGADDYMTKPFQPAELIARLHALTRRSGEVIIDQISFGDIKLDLSNYNLTCKNTNVKLSYREAEVLEYLMKNKNTISSKSTLITKIWGLDSEVEENNVEAYISFIRKKLKFLNSKVSISTQRKVGYKLEYND
ncbi:MAG: response regulator transcription factor [Coriobacteriales bacterium]|nr:response regulator transcription factor [Coriobacteriales bacterium]